MFDLYHERFVYLFDVYHERFDNYLVCTMKDLAVVCFVPRKIWQFFGLYHERFDSSLVCIMKGLYENYSDTIPKGMTMSRVIHIISRKKVSLTS